MILALAGGVGGAKLAHGLALALPPGELVVAVNTGDDFEHLGLHVSPDVDTVMYTLAGLADRERGWGLAGETWSFMDALARLGGPGWFRLGDRDLATHVERTRRLRAGESLSGVTRVLCEALGVRHAVVPMSDQPVRTCIRSGERTLDFQHYFVRERCEPKLDGLEFRGAGEAKLSAGFQAALADPSLEAIVVCPSNPWLSVAPMLAIPGLRNRIAQEPCVVAVSPVVGGQAIKGPAAKIMRELGVEPSALEIARHYSGIAKALVIDRVDEAAAPAIEALGMRAVVADSVMRDDAGREALARCCLQAAVVLGKRAAPVAQMDR
jgi:LPPG:FO 2-phospho-L-lactate transferase